MTIRIEERQSPSMERHIIMHDTPRTNAMQLKVNGKQSGPVPSSFARTLEHELTDITAAKIKAVEALKELCDWYADTHKEPMWERARKLIAELEEVK